MATLIQNREAKYLALVVPTIHQFDTVNQRVTDRCFEEAKTLLAAIFARGSRLRLPLEGVLLVGY